ncbi:MAG: citramalate synthase [Verrucomicrobiales bacterium]|jgi:2-isopropylmalate synthase|nr:citramalate synthase [Verrucomicrobiales bacterium]MBP9223060.1 citramalate synthase [Verrucomicrobiales bacterium]
MNQHPDVKLYDTTLRDGTQGEGVNFSSLDKIRIAKELDLFGMHYIEGGWPGSNPKDVSFFERAADLDWQNARIAAFGSTRRKNIAVEDDLQVRTLLEARTPVITFFGKSWRLHVKEILGTTEEENQAMIRDTTRYLKENGREVVYDAEQFFDGYKDCPEHALATLAAAKEGGADWLVLCDTNGGTMPHEIAEITEIVVKTLGIPVGIHTHDDAGVAVANALASILAGATQVQGTINGYGERVGNCNLTTVIPNLQLKMNRPVIRDVAQLTHLAHFVDDLANCAHNIRAPYVGATAFAHKGGMHVNAVQKVAHSFEHIAPATVGNHQRILVSELSGQSNVLMKAEELGLPVEKGSPEALSILQNLKDLEEQGYEFETAEASFELLIRKHLKTYDPLFELKEYHCTFRQDGVRNYQSCSATVKVVVNGIEEYRVAEGDGPVNALDGALRKALRTAYPHVDEMELSDYKVRIIDSHMGTAAKTRVLILSSDEHSNWGTVGVSSNIIEASWLALVDSVEYFLAKKRG